MKKILLILLFLSTAFSLFANEKNYFNEAKELFEDKKYEDSKFLFQRNIVYNPKDANSYLYLAKIFKIEEDKPEQEKNINTTLLLDPKNEEAMYLLLDMEIERSNFSKAKELKKNFKKICSLLCEKLTLIEGRLKEFEKKDAS
tara:strand:- start:283 stop:711 length:429 start_codon:yes stop_codon:yes gene_type:complete